MHRFILGLMLAVGLSSMVACLGSKEKDQEPVAEVQAPDEVELRHQQRAEAMAANRHKPLAERVEEEPVEIKSMERVGSEPGASQAAQIFVKRFVEIKYRVGGEYADPQMKYFPKTEEWLAFGVLQGRDPNLPRYTVECVVHLNDNDEWECRILRIDKKQVYAMDSPDPDVTLPNIKAGADGLPGAINAKTAAARDTAKDAAEDDGDSVSDPTVETPEKTAAAEADGDLRMAKTLMKRSPDKAKIRLQAIIDDFPDTPAAEEARELIQTIND